MARSLPARLVLGSGFDPVDFLWYLPGIVPLVVVHALVNRSRRRASGAARAAD